MRTFTDMDGSKIRRMTDQACITTTRYGIQIDHATLTNAEHHDEFMLALALALDDLKKIRKGGTVKPRKKPPSRTEWPPALQHK